MESLKRNWYLVLIISATVALGLIAVFTAVRLYKVGKKPVAPTAPLPAPATELTPTPTSPPPSFPCTLNFCISAPSPTVTPTPSVTPPMTPTPTPKLNCYKECVSDSSCEIDLRCQEVSGTKRCVNPSCPTESDCSCAPPLQPSPTPTVPQVELPEAGFTLPTVGVLIGGIVFVIASLFLAL